MARKSFDKDFKLEAVNMVTSQQRPVAAVARELGIHENTLYKWINQASENKEGAFPGSGNLSPEEAELRKLKRKILDLEEENAILKKATAYFAKHQK
jgi:transposase